MLLELKNIYKNYIQGTMEVPVLKDINLCVEEGEYVAIMGPSGSGKSTLMNIIGCIDKPTSGTYLLDDVEIEKCKDTQLSGGQKQRVAIARAMVADPKILLADEPTGALDSKSGLQVMELFDTLHKQGVTIIMITHSDEIASYADRVVKIIDGELYEGDAQPVTGGDEHE